MVGFMYVFIYVCISSCSLSWPHRSIFLAKNIKLQPVPPPMPLEALLTPDNLTYIASDGIGGATGCNFIFLLCRLLVVGPLLKWLALLIY